MGTVDFNSSSDSYNLTSRGWEDAFVSMLDSAGIFVWTKQIGGDNRDYGKSIAIGTSKHIYVCGHFSKTLNFYSNSSDLDLTSYGLKDGFMLKMKLDGSSSNSENISKNNTTKENIKIFFNPTNKILQITGNTIHADSKISVRNILEKVVSTKLVIPNKGKLLLNINSDRGVYFIDITTNKEIVKRLKVIKR